MFRTGVFTASWPITSRIDSPPPPELDRAAFLNASPARSLLAKMHASLGLSWVFAPRFHNPSRATAAHGERDRFDAAFRLFEQLAHAGIIDPALCRHRR